MSELSSSETFNAVSDIDVGGIRRLYEAVAVTPESLKTNRFKERGGIFHLPDTKEIKSWIGSPSHIVVATKDNGVIVGYSSAILDEESFEKEFSDVFEFAGGNGDVAYLRDIVVHPDCQRSKLTRAILRMVFENMAKAGKNAAIAEIYCIKEIEFEKGHRIQMIQDNVPSHMTLKFLSPEVCGEVERVIKVENIIVYITSTIIRFSVQSVQRILQLYG